MSTLAVLSMIGGIVQIPKTTNWLDNFLAPSFADSTIVRNPSNGLLAFGLVLGAVVGLAGIGDRLLRVGAASPGTAARLQARLRPIHTLLLNKWYFDELIDFVVVRPAAWFGRFGQQTIERVFVNGTIVGGTTGLVKAGSAAVRGAQTGFLRYYAGLLIAGLTVLGLYFLLQST